MSLNHTLRDQRLTALRYAHAETRIPYPNADPKSRGQGSPETAILENLGVMDLG